MCNVFWECRVWLWGNVKEDNVVAALRATEQFNEGSFSQMHQDCGISSTILLVSIIVRHWSEAHGNRVKAGL